MVTFHLFPELKWQTLNCITLKGQFVLYFFEEHRPLFHLLLIQKN